MNGKNASAVRGHGRVDRGVGMPCRYHGDDALGKRFQDYGIDVEMPVNVGRSCAGVIWVGQK